MDLNVAGVCLFSFFNSVNMGDLWWFVLTCVSFVKLLMTKDQIALTCTVFYLHNVQIHDHMNTSQSSCSPHTETTGPS